MGIRVIFEKDEEEEAKVIKIPIGLKSGQKEKYNRDGFVLEWEKALGYSKNPFESEILEPVSKYMANFENEKEKLNLFVIGDKKFGIVVGDKGTGKTVLLRWLAEQLERYKHKIVTNYIDGSQVKTNTKFVKELFRPSSGFKALSEKEIDSIDVENFGGKLREYLGHKKYVLIVDNMQKLAKEKFLVWDKLMGMDTQIIVAGDSELADSLNSIKDWLEGRDIRLVDELKIGLEGISLKGAKDMMAKRITKVGGKSFYPFDDELLKKIWLKAKRNPIRIIELCNDYAIELSVKKSEGLKVEDIRSYQKDGIKLEKSEQEEDFLVEGKEDIIRGKDYKIKVVNKNEHVVMEEEEGKKEKYVVRGKRK